MKYQTEAPTDKIIHVWYNFKETGCLCDVKWSGWPGGVENVYEEPITIV